MYVEPQAARDVGRATGIGEGTPMARGVIGVEEILQPEVDAMSPLRVEEIAAGQIDDGVVSARHAAKA